MRDKSSEAATNISFHSDSLMRETLNRKLSMRALRKADADYYRDQVDPLLDQASPHHVPHTVLRRIERQGLSVRRGLSFSAEMIKMSEARSLGVLRPSWALDAKNSAYALLDNLGVRRPDSDAKTYRFDEILETKSPGVVKATRSTGSRGCYLIFSENKIIHARDNIVFNSIEAFHTHARRLMSGEISGRKLPDSWMTEELILEDKDKLTPARDFKFYCFYGEIVLMQESRRLPSLEVAFWNEENETTTTGRYEDSSFEGVGIQPGHMEIVRAISEAIPHPFMRIDMLHGNDGLVFGEFTPRPGDFDEFNGYWDRLMGEAWTRAESRLLKDVLSGKKFDHYLDATQLV